MDSHLGSVHSGCCHATNSSTRQRVNHRYCTTDVASSPPPRSSYSPSPSSLSPLSTAVQVPARLTSSRCRPHTHLADATRACHLASCQASATHVKLDISPAGPYSGPRLVGYAYSWFRVYSLPSRMFLYLFFVLDSSLVFASLIPFAFAIGHRPRRSLGLCACCCASTHHSLTAFTLISEPLCLRRRAACRQ